MITMKTLFLNICLFSLAFAGEDPILNMANLTDIEYGQGCSRFNCAHECPLCPIPDSVDGALVGEYSIRSGGTAQDGKKYGLCCYDEKGYKCASFMVTMGESPYSLAEDSAFWWRGWHGEASSQRLNQAIIKKKGDAYYIYFTDKRDKTNTILSEVIMGNASLRLTWCGTVRMYWGGDQFPSKTDPAYPGDSRPTVEVIEHLATEILNTLNGKGTLKRDVALAEKREAMWKQRERQRELSRPGYADFYWNCWGLRTQCSLGSEVAEKLGITLKGEVPKDPNIHWDGLFAECLVKRVAKVLNRDNGWHFAVPEPPANDKFFHLVYMAGGSEGDTGVHVHIAHLLDSFQAKRAMYTFVTAKGDDGELEERFKTADEIIQAVRQLPKPPVGEYAVRLKPFVDTDGLPVKGSEKRSIYFTRGNTAVAVWTDNPAFNGLPAAREIDKLLVEGMRKAGEPLTREQEYLKEEKKQK